MIHDPAWMGPSVTITEAQSSIELRRQRDVELAAWMGQRTDDLSPFLAALRLYDRRKMAADMREASEALAHERLRRDLLAYWTQHEMKEAA